MHRRSLHGRVRPRAGELQWPAAADLRRQRTVAEQRRGVRRQPDVRERRLHRNLRPDPGDMGGLQPQNCRQQRAVAEQRRGLLRSVPGWRMCRLHPGDDAVHRAESNATYDRSGDSNGSWGIGAVIGGDCGAGCTPGTNQCSGPEYETCNSVGQWGGSVQSGQCGAAGGNPGQTQCAGAATPSPTRRATRRSSMGPGGGHDRPVWSRLASQERRCAATLNDVDTCLANGTVGTVRVFVRHVLGTGPSPTVSAIAPRPVRTSAAPVGSAARPPGPVSAVAGSAPHESPHIGHAAPCHRLSLPRPARELGRGWHGRQFTPSSHVHTGDHLALKVLLGQRRRGPASRSSASSARRALRPRIKSELTSSKSSTPTWPPSSTGPRSWSWSS